MCALSQTIYRSPLGELRLVARADQLLMCDWISSSRHQANLGRLGLTVADLPSSHTSPALNRAIAWLDAYFCGAGLPAPPALAPVGLPFQLSVWRALLSLHRGRTVSYSHLAAMTGRPAAVRAVATAVASNPLSIFIPCHLVTRSDGSIGNYAGGPAAKRRLIALESTQTY